MKFLILTFSTLLLSLTWSYSGREVTFHRSPDPFTLNASTSNVSLTHLTATTLFITPINKKQLIIANQNYTTVRGTRISLIKPEGFTEAKNFPGFQQTDTGASIVVTEMPAPYSQIASTFNTKKLKNRGMTLLRRQNFTIDGYEGQLLQVTQVAHFTTFTKWIAVFGDETETVMLVASLPQEMENTLSKPLRDSLISAKWQKNKVLDPKADLNFAIDTTPGLKFTQRVQNMLLYTKSGVIPAKSPEEPFFIVGPAFSKIEVTDQKQFAEKRIAQTAEIKNLSIDISNEIKINGLSGYEIVARAVDVQTNMPLVVYQVMLFEGQTYYIMQGIVGSGLKTEYLDDFHKMARSFRLK